MSLGSQYSNKEKGNAGLGIEIAYYSANGYTVSIPLNDTQDYDLVVDKDNILATWSESAGAMVRVNPDVTSVKPSEVVGQKEGNAVTNITYDANKREIIFEKGLTFVTEEVIGSLEDLSTKNKSNLVAAINEINRAMVEGTTGIKNMYIDDNNNLICELTNGTQINAGNIPSYKEISLINCGNANSAS